MTEISDINDAFNSHKGRMGEDLCDVNWVQWLEFVHVKGSLAVREFMSPNSKLGVSDQLFRTFMTMLKLITENNPSRRTPHPAKQKHNGFTEPPTESSKLKFPTGKTQNGEPEHVQVSDEALHRYREAMFILTQKDRPMPR
jgi:hypothetical protein